MAEVKLRFNKETEEVELIVDDNPEPAMSSGADVFKSWVDYYNEKHKPVPPPEPVKPAEPVEEKKVDVEEPVKQEEAAETETVEVETKDENAQVAD